ncbi:MAG: helix-turn-helix transcriptional regulator [Lutibacter sp.]|nr:helix-turn-helix transcriptional regulator [Lutibacter sp.]
MSLENTRNKILSVANNLFSKFGFHKTSMDEIAKIARKAKGSLYYHFASKEDLFKEVVSNEIINLKNQLSAIVFDNKINASEKINSYFIVRMEVLHNASNYHETIKADFFEHFEFIDDLRNDLDIWEKEKIKIIIEQGINNKEFEIEGDIDILLDVYIMVLKGLEIPFFIQDKYKNYEPYFNNLTRIFTKGLMP